ncbi:MAG: hypothetical protein WCO94_08605 [Verrucomicrobiota bacterium]
MDIKHITSDSLRRLLSLTDKKEQLIKAVSEVEDQIVRTLKGAATTTVEVAEAVTPFKRAKKAKKARKSKGSKPGGLKERILALLEEAGDEGIRVKDLAAKLASKPGNIAVWFSTTGKKLVTKVEPGRYAVKGAKKSAAKPAAAAPVAAARKKTSKPAKKKGGITPEGRAKLAANMKARWAARKAGKPAKKGFKLAKKS